MDPLDQIAQEGAELDTATGPAQGEQGAPAPTVDAEQEAVAFWAMIPSTIGNVLCIALPELKDTYSKEACLAWGTAANTVAKKRGWDVANSPEIALIGASLVFAVPTGVAIAKRVQERKAKAAELAGKPPNDRSAAEAAPAASIPPASIPPSINDAHP